MRRTPLVAALLSTALVLPLALVSPRRARRPSRPPPTTRSRGARALAGAVAPRPGWPTAAAWWWATGSTRWAPRTAATRRPGFHTRGEMGGFWTPPVKLLDGLWFKAGDTWLTSPRYTSGWGYQRMDARHPRRRRGSPAPTSRRTGVRAGLVGLRLVLADGDAPSRSAVDAHSELMKVYPWGETTPSQTTYNLQDTGARRRQEPAVPRAGHPAGANAEAHDYAALVGSTLTPPRTDLGPATAARRAT